MENRDPDAPLLIQNARVVTPEAVAVTDVLIHHGKIVALESIPATVTPRRLDASGLTLLPGVIDPHIHFREPGLEWKEDLESGSRAAVAGGVTSFLEMPNTRPPTIDAESMRHKKLLASQKSLANYNFFIGATPHNLEALNEVPNVCGIKIFMGCSTGDLLVSDPGDLETIFKNGHRLIAVHAEDDAIIKTNAERYKGRTDPLVHSLIRSPEAALAATTLAVTLAKRYRRRLHILHLTTRQEVEFLRREKVPGLISAEVCPQHLVLKAPDIYERLGTFAQMNPPIRGPEHAEALWQGLHEGVIDCIATDHAPHTREEKSKPYGEAPAGMPGVETSLPIMLNLVHQGRCRLQDLFRWMSRNPARCYGISGKGRIGPGMDADLVLVDTKKEKRVEDGQLVTKSNWSPFNGMTLTGWPVMTFVNGNLVYREGEFLTEHKGREIIFDTDRK